MDNRISQVRNNYKYLIDKNNKKRFENKCISRVSEITKGFDLKDIELLIIQWKTDSVKKNYTYLLEKRRKEIKRQKRIY